MGGLHTYSVAVTVLCVSFQLIGDTVCSVRRYSLYEKNYFQFIIHARPVCDSGWLRLGHPLFVSGHARLDHGHLLRAGECKLHHESAHIRHASERGEI